MKIYYIEPNERRHILLWLQTISAAKPRDINVNLSQHWGCFPSQPEIYASRQSQRYNSRRIPGHGITPYYPRLP